jgi:hypothetical protein
VSHERQRLTGDAIGGGKGLAVPFKREFLIDDGSMKSSRSAGGTMPPMVMEAETRSTIGLSF